MVARALHQWGILDRPENERGYQRQHWAGGRNQIPTTSSCDEINVHSEKLAKFDPLTTNRLATHSDAAPMFLMITKYDSDVRP